MTLALIPFIVCICGALLFGLLDGKASALGKDAFWCGLLVLLVTLVGKGVLTIHAGG